MTNKWNPNGMVIQDIKCSENCQSISPYDGVGRYLSWPLSNREDEPSKKITAEAEEKWFGYYQGDEFALATVPSIKYIEKYISMCKSQNIETRILWIETTRNSPRWQDSVPKTILLGYDYATSQNHFSALYDDLYGDKIPPILRKYKLALNSSGLLSKEEDLISYIKDRNIVIEQGDNIEEYGDFCMYRISVVKLNYR